VKVGFKRESLDFIMRALSVFRTNTVLLLLKFKEIIREIHSEKKNEKSIASTVDSTYYSVVYYEHTTKNNSVKVTVLYSTAGMQTGISTKKFQCIFHF
jgi:hypothetical protein